MFNAARDADYDALTKEVRAFGETLEAERPMAARFNSDSRPSPRRHGPACPGHPARHCAETGGPPPIESGEGHDERENGTSIIKRAGITAERADLRTRLARLKANLAQIVAIDFFGANGREIVDGLIAGLEAQLDEEAAMKQAAAKSTPAASGFGALTNRVWVTRQGVYVDRIASAWLIRRFIDPDARFRFVRAKNHVPQPGELRFDMFEAEFTHEGDRCTFEVLLGRLGSNDKALTAIAEIVHDIDLKDTKFGREETGGIAHLVTGLCHASKDDARRLEQGAGVFDNLYEYFRKRRG
ncbi:MAG: hypothetical protein EXR07_14470 [Acetobacteraceae bacterium]|nr:hypothetical protein [Acetobacteraceae bacterium]